VIGLVVVLEAMVMLGPVALHQASASLTHASLTCNGHCRLVWFATKHNRLVLAQLPDNADS
jgi:hypothetical protein